MATSPYLSGIQRVRKLLGEFHIGLSQSTIVPILHGSKMERSQKQLVVKDICF
jgi:hypothetical protein